MTTEAISKDELQRRFEKIRNGDDFTDPTEVIPHSEILGRLISEMEPVSDFKQLARRYKFTTPEDRETYKREKIVLVLHHVMQTAKQRGWGLCKRHDSVYIFNGAWWVRIDKDDIQSFLGEVAQKIGVDDLLAKYHGFRSDLIKQFLSDGHLSTPDINDGQVLINLKNGTVEIDPKSSKLINIRKPQREDFLTYQLPFKYDPEASAPRFKRYLAKVLPNTDLQKILAEFLGYVFIKTSQLKLEKALILHGSGANGKSVFFDVINSLLGTENVSTFSLESLTNGNGYYRAKIANKLVNYGSEISTKMEPALFKQMVSGEPVEARLPYGQPFIMDDYAKMIFNCNELPTDVEHTNAFFRRFMIVPFDVTIPEAQQDKELSKKIINSELSGVFNWVLGGLKRVLKQRGFTKSEVISNRNDQYRQESDSVQMFISERDYSKSVVSWTALKELYAKYKSYCDADGYYPVAKRKFSKRLEAAGYKKVKKSVGMSFQITDDE